MKDNEIEELEKIGNQIKIQALLNEARYTKNTLGRPKKAIKLCNKILKIDPDNRDALLIKAGGLNESLRWKEALTLIEQIIKKWPNHWEAYYLASANHFALNKDEEALEKIDKSIELNNNFNNIVHKAQMLCLLGKDYEEWVERAKKIDKKRMDNFMKNIWIDELDRVKPSFLEVWRAKRALKNETRNLHLRRY